MNPRAKLSHSIRKLAPTARGGPPCLNAAGVRAPLSPHASLAPDPGKDAFHRVPLIPAEVRDAVERVLTGFGDARRVPVVWQDCSWQAQVIVLPEPSILPRRAPLRASRSGPLLWSVSPTRRNTQHPSSVAALRRVDATRNTPPSIPSNSMKTYTDTHARGCKSAPRASRGFTLVELLVVISIIAILAAMLLPVIGRVKVKAQAKRAQIEAINIVGAIHSYEADYSKFPVSSVGALTAMSEATRLGEDFTFGTKGVTCVGPGGNNPYDQGFSRPGGYQTILAPGNYQTNNAEVMAALLDVEYWPAAPALPTINKDHVKNPQKTHYLTATMAGDFKSPGIGQDGIYRDPWGNPYIITVDLNYDEKARDAFYRSPAVSQDLKDSNTPKRGLNGLIPKVVGGSTFYEANGPVMVWSAGPDKLIDPAAASTAGVNKDNVLSWK